MKLDEGKAWGVLEALNWACFLDLQKVIIETDAKHVSDTYRSSELDDTSFGDYIEAMKNALSEHTHFSIKWVSQNANTTIHSLARMPHLYESPRCWIRASKFSG